MQYNGLTEAEYVERLVALISAAEGHIDQAANIGDGKATIGYGYTFNRNDNLALWQAAGITLTAAEILQLQAIDNAAPADRTALALQFSRTITHAEAQALLGQTYQLYEGPADDLEMPFSAERAAFVSLTYNRGTTNLEARMQGFFDAVSVGDRAEAWFQMRYMSWGTATAFEAGLRARRLIESTEFGLYDDADVDATEAKSVYAMLAAHREAILQLEGLWGENPDGTDGTRNLVEEVNNDTRWGDFEATTIVEAFRPARDAFVTWANTKIASEGGTSLLALEWNPISIYYDPASQNLDATADDEATNGVADNILIGGDAHATVMHGGAGNDVLIGGDYDDSDELTLDDYLYGDAGNDHLYGGNGQDLLSGGDGDDYLFGGGGNDSVLGGAGNDTLILGGGTSRWPFQANAAFTGDGNDTVYARNGISDVIVNYSGFDEIYIDSWDEVTTTVPSRIHYGNEVIDLTAAFSLTESVKFYESSDGALAFWAGVDGQAVTVSIFSSSKELLPGSPVGTASWEWTQGDPTIWAHQWSGGALPNIAVSTGTEPPLVPGESPDGSGLLSGTEGSDILVGDAGSQTLDGRGGDDTLDGAAGNDVVAGGEGVDHLNGGDGDDLLSGNAGNDVLDGGDGADMLRGQEGNDTLIGNMGMDQLYGGAGDDLLEGGADTDVLVGGDGADQLSGNEGFDVLEGGAGDDVYSFELGDGADWIRDTDATSGNSDTLILGTGIVASQLVSEVDGNDRVFTIQGTLDTITLKDWYVDPNSRIERIEFADGTIWDGIALAQSPLNGTPSADSLSGTEAEDLIHGLAGNDLIYANGGNDTLSGDTGDDELSGGEGNDTYLFAAGDGHDTIYDGDTTGGLDVLKIVGPWTPSDFNVFQRDNSIVFQLIATGDSVTVFKMRSDLTGQIEGVEFGNGAIWTQTQLQQGIPIVGDENNNIDTGTSFDDVAYGNVGFDTIDGGAGNDLLDGGADDDTLIGGQGNDVYVVDSEFDVLTELSAQGTDEVRSTLTWTLATNFENLQLLGVDNIDGTGNSVANVITGNAGDNLIDGKAGADTLAGGAGNDIYVIDNVGDIVSENSAEGVDLVRSSVSFTLGANVENLTLTGSSAINATGNDLDNVLTGNSGNNVLTGGLGNDIYVVAQAGDSAVEGASAGIDLVQSSVTHTLLRSFLRRPFNQWFMQPGR